LEIIVHTSSVATPFGWIDAGRGNDGAMGCNMRKPQKNRKGGFCWTKALGEVLWRSLPLSPIRTIGPTPPPLSGTNSQVIENRSEIFFFGAGTTLLRFCDNQ
jgi:hypothetical protein